MRLLSVFRSIASIICLSHLVEDVSASAGDRSYVFNMCLKDCDKVNSCATAGERFSQQQPFHMRLFLWTCMDECKYSCMWTAVEAFRNDQLSVPQFYGKWPFVRVLGIQEPLSVLFSVLNGVAHAFMLFRFLVDVPNTAPTRFVWICYSLVAMNTWLWSTIFHTRDLPLTEMLDYFCAMLFVLYSLFGLCVRMSINSSRWYVVVVAVIMLMFYCSHVHYLAFVSFDYGYNMMANVTIGLIHSIVWCCWSVWSYRKKGVHHAWRAGASALSVTLLSTLELGDFPPLLWALDAHALWHASTIPVVFLWYRSRYFRVPHGLPVHHISDHMLTLQLTGVSE